MNLRAYLDQPGMSATALARQVGVSHTTVLRWADGTFCPGACHLQAIVAATGGAVTAAELNPHLARIFARPGAEGCALVSPPDAVPSQDAA